MQPSQGSRVNARRLPCLEVCHPLYGDLPGDDPLLKLSTLLWLPFRDLSRSESLQQTIMSLFVACGHALKYAGPEGFWTCLREQYPEVYRANTSWDSFLGSLRVVGETEVGTVQHQELAGSFLVLRMLALSDSSNIPEGQEACSYWLLSRAIGTAAIEAEEVVALPALCSLVGAEPLGELFARLRVGGRRGVSNRQLLQMDLMTVRKGIKSALPLYHRLQSRMKTIGKTFGRTPVLREFTREQFELAAHVVCLFVSICDPDTKNIPMTFSVAPSSPAVHTTSSSPSTPSYPESLPPPVTTGSLTTTEAAAPNRDNVLPDTANPLVHQNGPSNRPVKSKRATEQRKPSFTEVVTATPATSETFPAKGDLSSRDMPQSYSPIKPVRPSNGIQSHMVIPQQQSPGAHTSTPPATNVKSRPPVPRVPQPPVPPKNNRWHGSPNGQPYAGTNGVGCRPTSPLPDLPKQASFLEAVTQDELAHEAPTSGDHQVERTHPTDSPQRAESPSLVTEFCHVGRHHKGSSSTSGPGTTPSGAKQCNSDPSHSSKTLHEKKAPRSNSTDTPTRNTINPPPHSSFSGTPENNETKPGFIVTPPQTPGCMLCNRPLSNDGTTVRVECTALCRLAYHRGCFGSAMLPHPHAHHTRGKPCPTPDCWGTLLDIAQAPKTTHKPSLSNSNTPVYSAVRIEASAEPSRPPTPITTPLKPTVALPTPTTTHTPPTPSTSTELPLPMREPSPAWQQVERRRHRRNTQPHVHQVNDYDLSVHRVLSDSAVQTPHKHKTNIRGRIRPHTAPPSHAAAVYNGHQQKPFGAHNTNGVNGYHNGANGHGYNRQLSAPGHDGQPTSPSWASLTPGEDDGWEADRSVLVNASTPTSASSTTSHSDDNFGWEDITTDSDLSIDSLPHVIISARPASVQPSPAQRRTETRETNEKTIDSAPPLPVLDVPGMQRSKHMTKTLLVVHFPTGDRAFKRWKRELLRYGKLERFDPVGNGAVMVHFAYRESAASAFIDVNGGHVSNMGRARAYFLEPAPIRERTPPPPPRPLLHAVWLPIPAHLDMHTLALAQPHFLLGPMQDPHMHPHHHARAAMIAAGAPHAGMGHSRY